MMTSDFADKRTINEWADLWRYEIGANVIPADTKNKKTWIQWSQYQTKAIPKEQHDEWKAKGSFNQGMAVICGKLWHKIAHSELYLAAIDLDNLKAIEEVVPNGLKDLATRTIVEYHKDNTSKAHIYFFTERPITKKSSDAGTHIQLINNNEIPALEIKGDGTHGIMYCTPSPHKGGFNYEILGVEIPARLNADQLENMLNEVCKKYGIKYLEAAQNGKASTPINELFADDFVVLEGHNRHEALLRAMESLIVRTSAIFGEEKIKELSQEWNQKHCRPPLDTVEFEKQWNDAKEFIVRQNRKQQENKLPVDPPEKENKVPEDKLLTVNEALAVKPGQIKVRGVVVSVSRSYDLQSPEDETQYTQCRSIYLQDENSEFLSDKLEVILTGELRDLANVGELVTIEGNLRISSSDSNKKGNKKGSKIGIRVLRANSVKNERKKDLVLTEKDIKEIKEFANDPNVIGKLEEKFAQDIIGHEDVKRGILRSAIGAPEREGKRGRIHTLLIGVPGESKTPFLGRARKLVSGSREVSGTNSTGKSIVGFVDKEDDHKVLRIGAAVLAKHAIMTIDEIGTVKYEDQTYLLNIMEEGRTVITKQGFSAIPVNAPTTIIATANPITSEFKNEEYVDLSEIPLLRTLIDRNDQIYIFRRNKNIDYLKEYADKKSILITSTIDYEPDYEFLQKYIQYAKTINPVIPEEVRKYLNNAWVEIASADLGDKRAFEGIYRMVQAQARLHLSDIVTLEIADEVLDDIRDMLKARNTYQAEKITDLKELTIKAICKVVQDECGEIAFKRAIEKVCEEDERISVYVRGSKSRPLEASHNRRYNEIQKVFTEKTPKGVRVHLKKPLTLISETTHNLREKIQKEKQQEEKKETGLDPLFRPKGRSHACPPYKDDEVVMTSGNQCLSIGFKKGGN